ncbi:MULTISPECIES: hypothetical protein [unclassified Bradyrhizobium]|uniref:hypothetical protein n=1 Tax=unclassified Bradyrhizobium TaxID=2631580 RepID=UPI0028E967C7|nr:MULTISPECIES: hypothetical protein [unclassified Bradyrhizobium]
MDSTTCMRATDACFALAGASAVYNGSPLQRRLRDLRAAAQHGAVRERLYAGADKPLLERYAGKLGSA